MNTLKTTMSKIAQIEQPERTDLAKHEVELALIDDLKKYTQGFAKYENEGVGLKNRGERLQGELRDVRSALSKWSQVGESLSKDLLNDLSKFEKAAKELGLNPKENKEYLNAEQTYKSLVELSKAWLRVRDNLGQI